MKDKEKKKLSIPRVHIYGDLEQAIHLVSKMNKKKSMIIYRDAIKSGNYALINGEKKGLTTEKLDKMKLPAAEQRGILKQR
jgi:hypothetical protein